MTRSTAITREVGQAIGTELSSLGINCNLAPVIETNIRRDDPLESSRRYASEVNPLIQHASAFLAGLHDSGMISVATESFHKTLQEAYRQMRNDGTIDVDQPDTQEVAILQHLGAEGGIDALQLSSITQTFDHYFARDEAIEAIIESVVRQKSDFQGPIISNNVPHNSLSPASSCLTHEPLRLLLTGCDLVYLPMDPAVRLASIDAIYCAVDANAISLESLDQSCSRVMTLKNRYLSWPGMSLEHLQSNLPSLLERHAIIAAEAYRKSIQLSQDAQSPLLSLARTSPILLLAPSMPSFIPVLDDQSTSHNTPKTFAPLENHLRPYPLLTRLSRYDISLGLESHHRELFPQFEAIVLVLVSSDTDSRRAYITFWRNVERRLLECEGAKPRSPKILRVVVGFGVENDLVGETSEYLLRNGWWGLEACGWEEVMQKYVAEILVGSVSN